MKGRGLTEDETLAFKECHYVKGQKIVFKGLGKNSSACGGPGETKRARHATIVLELKKRVRLSGLPRLSLHV